VSLGTEAAQRGVAPVNDALEVHIHGPRMVGNGDFLEAANRSHACVVEPDVDAAEAPLGSFGESFRGIRTADVHGDDESLATGCAN
jgi:hypothetical protein